MKLLKDKSILDKLIIDDKNEFVAQKIIIHDELRLKMIEILNKKTHNLSKENNELSNENRSLKDIIVNLKINF